MEAILFIISVLLLILVLTLVYDIRNTAKSLSKRTIKTERRDAWTLSIGILASILVIVSLFMIFGKESFSSETGWMGDTIGGVTAPFINGLAAVLVYMAFKAQVKANELVHTQFKEQQIESRFFELLKLHRDNVAEIGIGDVFGKKIFVTLIREFRLIHVKMKSLNKEEKLGLTKEGLIEVSYLILFFGFGPNSSRQLKRALKPFGPKLFKTIEPRFDSKTVKQAASEERKFRFIPFEGHQSRLGHYFRHLFQTVDYIDISDISDEKKYAYVKALRAQLTTHEQALLYVNSFCPAGSMWWRKKFMTKYKMVKNIPPDFFHPQKEIDMEMDERFPEGYFEYQQT